MREVSEKWYKEGEAVGEMKAKQETAFKMKKKGYPVALMEFCNVVLPFSRFWFVNFLKSFPGSLKCVKLDDKIKLKEYRLEVQYASLTKKCHYRNVVG